MDSPKISVCLPAYNRVEYAREAIKSVLSQTYNDYELIISDDASTENIEGMVSSFNDKRLKYFKQKVNLGFIKNWNFCLDKSRGSYIKILGDDDVLLPDCLEKSVRVLEDKKVVGMVCSDYWTIDGVGKLIDSKQFNSESFRVFKESKIENGRQFIKEYFFGARRVGLPSAILFKKDLLRVVGNFDEAAGSPADIDLWLRILRISDFYYIDEKLLNMRWHEGNLSQKLEDDPFYYRYLIDLLSKNYRFVKKSFTFIEKVRLFFIYSRSIAKRMVNIKLLRYEIAFCGDIATLANMIFRT